MTTVIVPNALREAIHASITKKLGGRPCGDAEREGIYQMLLNYFDQHGVIPDFNLKAKQ